MHYETRLPVLFISSKYWWWWWWWWWWWMWIWM